MLWFISPRMLPECSQNDLKMLQEYTTTAFKIIPKFSRNEFEMLSNYLQNAPKILSNAPDISQEILSFSGMVPSEWNSVYPFFFYLAIWGWINHVWPQSWNRYCSIINVTKLVSDWIDISRKKIWVGGWKSFFITSYKFLSINFKNETNN